MAKYVRLKPYERKRGHLLRRLTVNRARFDESRGWYKVDEAMAATLSKLQQPPAPNSLTVGNEPKAFDICDSLNDAKEVVKQDKAKEKHRNPDEANDMRLSDLTRHADPPQSLDTEEVAPPARRTTARRSTR